MIPMHRKMISISAAALGAALAGCAAIPEQLDHYADRMTTYNKEAELAQDRSILLNVLRASKRRPLSFFELQSVSAAGTPSGQIGLSFPLTQTGGAATTVSPSFSLSGGPTVSGTYIDNQEFYQGILKPISLDTIDFFVQRGIPDNLLFNLFFSRATVRLHKSGKDGDDAGAAAAEHTFVNYVGDDGALDGYQKLVTVLLNSGLTTGVEPAAEPTNLGPPLTAEQVADPDVLMKLSAAKLKLASVKWCDLSETERLDIERRGKTAPSPADACTASAPAPAAGGKAKAVAAPPAYALGGYYRIRQKGGDDTSHTLCFSRTAHAPGGQPRAISGEGACEATGGKGGKVTLHAISGCTLAEAMPDAFPEMDADLRSKGCAGAPTYDIEFTPRSTYGVIYYLGEVVRRAHYPDNGRPARVVMVRSAPITQAIDPAPCPTEGSGACRAVFQLETASRPAQEFLGVGYDGMSFAVPDREGHAGLTDEVLDIVSELIALNRSSKDAPTSSLVTLVGR